MSTVFDSLSPQQKKLAYERAASKLQEMRAQLPSALRSLELELDRRRCESFAYFVQKAWHLVESSTPLKWNWHHTIITTELERSSSIPDFIGIINVPPGTTKSLLVSVFYRAWLWSLNPSLRFINASYGGHLSTEFNVSLRKIVTSPWYQDLFPKVRLTDDVNRKERFDTTEGGWSIATSVGGVGTGEHPDYFIVDDPLTEEQSRSEADRKAANAWLSGTVSTRGMIKGVKLWMVMQRLHEDDPTGFLLAKNIVNSHIVFPMRFDPKRADPRDPRTEQDELLWPEVFTEEKVRKLEIKLGPYGTASQLQQRPAPEGGGLFKREWFKYVEAAPLYGCRRARGWDTAATEDGGDWTAGVKIAEQNGLFFIEHVLHEQLSPAGVNAIMLYYAKHDTISCVQRELQEPAASGKSVISARTHLLKGYDHKGVRASKDKVTMAKPFRAQVEAGNVYIVRTGNPAKDAWIEPFLSELCDFPTGKHDDQVDGASCAFNSVLLEPPALVAAPSSVGEGESYWTGVTVQ